MLFRENPKKHNWEKMVLYTYIYVYIPYIYCILTIKGRAE